MTNKRLSSSTPNSSANKDPYNLVLDGLAAQVGETIMQTEYEAVQTGSCRLCDAVEIALAMGLASRDQHDTFHKIVNGFQQFLGPLNRFSGGLDSMSQASPIASVVWGSIKMMLVVARDLQENFQILMQGLRDITESLPRHALYWTIVSSEQDNPLRPPLIRIYVEIIVFAILAVRYLRSKPSKMRRATLDEINTVVKEIRSLSCHRGSTTLNESNYTIGSRRISNVPGGLLSSNFLFRDAELMSLNSMCHQNALETRPNRAAIYGMTGVGKTQLMLKFEQENRDRYDYAFWVVSGSRAKVHAGLQEILDLLGLPERAQSEHHMKEQAIKSWLAKMNRWLLMFDNITEDDYAMISNLLPASSNGCALFTSQRPGAVNVLTGNLNLHNCIELKVPKEDDAIALFLTLSKVEETMESRTLALNIVNEVGQLPHAINQSASYIFETNVDLAGYLAHLRSDKDRVLAWKEDFSLNKEPVTQSFTAILRALDDQHPDSASLLRVFAYFEPECIPQLQPWRRDESYELPSPHAASKRSHIFANLCCGRHRPSLQATSLEMQKPQQVTHFATAEATIRSKVKWDHAISKLWSFSLIRRIPEKRSIWIHDLTHHFIRQVVPKTERKAWLCLAIDVLYHTFPERDNTVDERLLVDLFLPHAASVLRQAQESGVELNKYAKLLSICAFCFHNRGNYVRAIKHYELARSAFEAELGPRHHRTLTLLHRMGWSFREQGKFSLAESYHRKTLAARIEVLGENAIETLEAMNDLASVIERQGRLKEAESWFSQAYKAQQLAFGPFHAGTIASAHNLALCYANQGQLGPAENLYRLTLKTSEAERGFNDPGTLKTLSNLAVCVDHQGNLEEAAMLYDRALSGYQTVYGVNHLLTLRVRCNVTGLYRINGQFEKAESYMREALEEYLRILGPEHPHVAIAYYDLAEILHEKGSLNQAKNFYSQSIQLMQKDSAGHPLLYRTIDGLSILCCETGALEEARTLSKRAYQGNLELLGWDDPYTMMSAHSNAELLHAEGKLTEAEKLYERCKTGFEEMLGAKHPHALMVLHNLGRLELERGNPGNAKGFLDDSIRGYRSILRDDHPCILKLMVSIGRMQLAHGLLGEARTSIEQAHEGLTKIFGSQDAHTMVANYYLSVLDLHQGSFDSARDRLSNTVRAYVNTLGARHPDCVRATVFDAFVQQRTGLALQLPNRLEELNNALTQLHSEGYRGPLPTKVSEEFLYSLPSSFQWTSLKPLAWGEVWRMRWGRKTVWREANQSALDG